MEYRPPRSGSRGGPAERSVPPRAPAPGRRAQPGDDRRDLPRPTRSERDERPRRDEPPRRAAHRAEREVPRQASRSEGSQPRRRVSGAALTERIEPPPRPRPARKSAPPPRRHIGGKVFLSLLSAAILLSTGYYWRVADSFANDLTTADVIEAAGERPADGAVDILMVGMDSRTDAQGNPLSKEQLAMLNAGKADGEINTDTLIMIRIPNDGGKAVGISIPRDSYVDIPGFGKHKINSAYGRAKLAARSRLQKEGVTEESKLEVASNQEGARSLIATIGKLTGASIDHYAEVNLLGFYDITNAIGGIDVCLNKAVKDSFSGANFPAGPQNLQGAPALAFVRQRHGLPNGDLDRIARQQVFMGGMAKKVFSQDVFTPGSSTLGKLQEAITKSVVLDKNWNIMQFAQQMMSVTGGNIQFATVPHGTIDLDTPGDGKAVEVDPTEVKSFVGGLLGGQTSVAAQAPPTEAAPAKPTVTVLNASGRTGLAAEVSDTLSGKGFKTTETGNATTRTKSVVRYAKGEEANGTAVVSAIGKDIPAEQDANVAKGKVTVLIGKDFGTNAAIAGDPLVGTPPLRLDARQQPGPVCVN
ncbi:LCP family protein [Actinokineospora sp. NBRC 105648]|uniref:LCP family protein n=1 Tax=Actinokineospora sp. NBRC 105648 TaxID=3032206 RepID=UPI00255505BA|nr:LCP family protein [Actinokineospora sp. NBRC 105648]